MTNNQDTNPKASVLAIGNEILTGKTLDANSNWIAQKLSDHGIRLCEIRVIPDDEKVIISSLKELKAHYDFVVTTGGIGPTHDDITAKSIAKCFYTNLEVNKQAYECLVQYYGSEDQMNTGRKKMAMIPQGAKLIPNPVTAAPGFHIGNVYVLAGVPKIVKAMLDYVLEKEKPGMPYLIKQILSTYPESCISDALSSIQNKYEDVEIGSYPAFDNPDYSVKIIIRGLNEKSLSKAAKDVRRALSEIEKE